jgi:Protein of unknown function (DUF2800)
MLETLPAHSPFGGSGAHRWIACPGSVQFTRGMSESPSMYAQEGTAGHAIAALCLTEKQDAIEYVDRTVEGIEIDEDLAAAVQTYVNTIREDQAERGGKLLVEQKFHLKHLHPQFFGTADCVRPGLDKTLTVYDAKFGRGEIVEVTRPGGAPNLQLAFYALGALHELARVIALVGISHVELVIVQPRAWHRDGPVRSAIFSLDEIRDVADELVHAAFMAERPDAKLVVGDHCTFCRGAATCPALRAHSLMVAQVEFDDDMAIVGKVPDPGIMTPVQLGNVLDAAEIFETWLTAVRNRAHILAESQSIPGWKLVNKQARRKWSDETKVPDELCFGFGVEIVSMYERKLKSPAQMEKLLTPQDRKSEAFKALCPPVSSGFTLVKESNPRPGVIPAQLDFDDGTSVEEDGEW